MGNFPINLVLSADGKYVVSTDVGTYQSLWSIRTADGVGVSHVDYAVGAAATQAGGEAADGPEAPGSPRTNGLYYGLAMGADGTLYAAQGGHDSVAVLKLSAEGILAQTGEIKTRREDFPAGVALDGGGRLYVANNASGNDDPFKLTASVAIYDTESGKELGRYAFSGSHGGTSNFPLGIGVLRDGSKVFVCSERDDAVYVLDARDAGKPALEAMIGTGAHPVGIVFSKDQSRAFVANSLGDTISVIDTARNKVVGTIMLRPAIVRDVPGVTPLGMAISSDDRTLYVALADMNAIGVVDLRKGEVRGYVQAGWYPTAVELTQDGTHVIVANAKGTTARRANNIVDPHNPKRKTAAILSLTEGNVCSVKIPTGDDLEESTKDVLKENRLTDLAEREGKNPLAGIGLVAGKIKHVIYVIKENRTYDQVMGDVAKGNGDPSLVLFGKDVTPNQHALADRFVLLDNLYASGEVSGDGWAWSTQGMADAYVERNVPYSYSRRGRKFDFEAHNNGYPTGGVPAVGVDGKPAATAPSMRNGVPAIPDVGNTGRNLWDAAREAGVSFRNYGFFLYFTDRASGTAGGPDNYPAAIGLQPAGHDLVGISDLDFRRFDLDFPDSDAPAMYFEQTGDAACLYKEKGYGKENLPSRFAEWNREFQMMLAKDGSGGGVPPLMFVRFPTDHTAAARSGAHSPRSYVADNDYAVGELVEAVSHSAIWESTAIVIVEDDAQNGVDHVDAHRTTCFIASPWIKAGSVDHRFYNTDSVLKTMELLLGLKPLSQYDAIADPILDWDTAAGNRAAFSAIVPPKELVAELNPKAATLKKSDPQKDAALRSDAMDFTHADAAPAEEVNTIIWQTVKGAGSKMPAPRGVADKDDD